MSLRKRLGLRAVRLAQMSGIDRARLSMWENGHLEITPEEMDRLARCLAQELTLLKQLDIPMAVSQ